MAVKIKMSKAVPSIRLHIRKPVILDFREMCFTNKDLLRSCLIPCYIRQDNLLKLKEYKNILDSSLFCKKVILLMELG